MSDSAGTSETSLRLQRVFAAPVADVFEAWTDPALMQRWLAPSDWEVLEASADVRPGGYYRILVAGPGGSKVLTTGEYLEVIPSKRLVQTWVAEGLDPEFDRYPTLLTVEFREAGPRSTEITLIQDRLMTAPDRARNRGGWQQCFEKLDALLR
jgi:uncharacterized protein YndB with AHSA1/START domain